MAYRNDEQDNRYRDEQHWQNRPHRQQGRNQRDYDDDFEKRRRSYDEYYRWGGASGHYGQLNTGQGYNDRQDHYSQYNDRYDDRREMGRRDGSQGWNRDEDMDERGRNSHRRDFKPVLTRHLYEDGRPDPQTGPYWPYPEGYMPRGKTGRNWTDRIRDEVASWFGDNDAERRREHDKHPKHRGKGPKGYQRSDERLKEVVNDLLYEDDFIDASDIEVEVTNGDVILQGMVNSKYEKRRAEYLVDMVTGVKNVENRLRVNTVYEDQR